MKNCIIFSILTFIVLNINAQKVIKLTNIKNNKEIILNENTRVSYSLNDKNSIKIGEINLITDTIIQIKDKSIKLVDFKSIGKRKYGIGAIGVAGCTSGTLLGIAASENNWSTGARVTGYATGIILFCLAEYIAIKNSPKKMKKWRITIS